MAHIVSKRTLVCLRGGLKTKHQLQNTIKKVKSLPTNQKRKVNRELIENVEDYNRWVDNFLKQVKKGMKIKKNKEGGWV